MLRQVRRLGFIPDLATVSLSPRSTERTFEKLETEQPGGGHPQIALRKRGKEKGLSAERETASRKVWDPLRLFLALGARPKSSTDLLPPL